MIVPRNDGVCGFDCSSFSGVVNPIKIAERGFRFGVARMSYGAELDERFEINARGIENAMMRLGAYGYLRTGMPLGPQLDLWSKMLEKFKKPMFWVDFESLGSGVSPQMGIDRVAMVNSAIKDRLGIRPMFYSYLDFITHKLANCDLSAIAEMPLCLARYAGLNAPVPAAPAPWKLVTKVQYAGNQTDHSLAEGFLDLCMIPHGISFDVFGPESDPFPGPAQTPTLPPPESAPTPVSTDKGPIGCWARLFGGKSKK